MGNWSQPQSRSSVLDEVKSSSFERNPRELQISNKDFLDIGESVVVRILSLAEEDTLYQQCRSCRIKNKEGNMAPYPVRIPYPGDEVASDIFDDDGNPMSEAKAQNVWYVPVWALFTCDKNGIVDEEISDLKYIPMLPSLAQAIKKLQQDDTEGTAFEAIPNYSIRIKVVKPNNGGKRGYEVTPCVKYKVRKGSSTTLVEDDTYGVDDLEKAIGKEEFAYVVDNIEAMMQEVREACTDEAKPENVKRRFYHYRQEAQKDGDSSGASATSKRGFTKSRPEPEPDDDDSNEDAEDAKEPVEESSKPNRGLRGGGRFSGKG